MNADVCDDVLDNIDELMNFSCEDPEGDMIGAQSLEDICGSNCDGLFSGEGDTTSLLHKHLLPTLPHHHPDEDTPISAPHSIRSCSEIQNMPINAGLVVPGKAHIKRRRTEVFVHPPMIPLMSPSSSSTDPPTTLKIPDPIATELKKWRKQKKLPVMLGSVEQSSSQQSRPVQKCLHCDITETPRWRTGPLGMTLCNACWLEFNRCLYFPEYRSAASQTFLTPAHSNSQPVIPLISPSSTYPIPPTTVKRQKSIATELKKRKQKKPTAPGSSEHTALRQTRPDRRKCLCCDVTETPQSRVGPLRKRQSAGSPTIITLSDSETDPIPSENDPIPPLSSELSSKSEDSRESTIKLEVPKPVAGSNIKLPPLPDSIEHPMPIRKCLHCGITKTPLWRMGPSGPRTLCNACGVRYRTGRLFPEYRPAASPTFVPTLHSNSHKKLLKMRYKNLSEGNILAQV